MFSTLKALTLFGLILLANYCLSADVALSQFGLRDVLGEKEYYFGVLQKVKGEGFKGSHRSFKMYSHHKGVMFYDFKVNWYRAAQICSAIGMSLTAIESEAEYKNLNSYLFSNSLASEQFWLSGTDLALGSEYIWLESGKKFNYTKWATGQPTTSNRCVRTNEVFDWATANCADANYFICSRPTVPSCGATGRCSYHFY